MPLRVEIPRLPSTTFRTGCYARYVVTDRVLAINGTAPPHVGMFFLPSITVLSKRNHS